ncbi:unnamed protein product [Allacma fusca]|uniref:Uncharacterized protein n=1 Tax=Allacma fusca TaxID=39272 RepID=A0A8J2LAW8_9HEXA|nr:unnamed protein product [Allacma fusca]
MCNNSDYLLTSVGALKVLHVIFGAFSIGLIADTFVPIQDEIIFACVVSVAFTSSLVYLLSYLKWKSLGDSKINGRIDFAFHIIGGICLSIAGIDLTTWDDYFEVCQQSCPSLYTKGVAKILTFVNGVLYGIVAFLLVKEDELTKEEEITDSDLDEMEDFPIMFQSKPKPSRGSFNQPRIHYIYRYQTINEC